MAIEIKVPAAGESITSATIGRWHKPDGASVRKGEAVVTLETDKVSHELEAEADGVLGIQVAEGEEVEIGTVIGRIEEAEAASADEPENSPVDADNQGEKESEPEPPAVEAQAPQEPVEVKVPPAGESITTATLAAWQKSDGDRVARGDSLVTIETDKVSNQLEAEIGGVIRIKVSEGEEVPIGTVIALIEPQKVEASAGDDAPVPTEEKLVEEEPVAEPASAEPQAAEAPAESKPDLAVVPEPSVEPAAPVDSPAEGRRTTRRKMSPLRRKIATHLVNAQQTSAILTTFNEVDMSAVMKLRKEVQEDFVHKHGIKLGFMSFFLKAATQALRDVPQLNARIDGKDIVENHFFDIGVAVGIDKGLVVPVVRDVDKKGFARLERDILDYAQRARDGKIQLDDLQGGVFTISNGGVYGSLLSTPILNPPQSGILGMHTIQQRPVAVDGEVVIRPMMYLALSYDHRIIDGRDAVTFLIRIKECIECPVRLLLDM